MVVRQVVPLAAGPGLVQDRVHDLPQLVAQLGAGVYADPALERLAVERDRAAVAEVFEAMPGDGVVDIVTFREEDGRTTERIDLLHFIGWSPPEK